MKAQLYLTATVLLTCASCAGHGVYPVSGQVMYNGLPAAGAVVSFHRQGGESGHQQLIQGTVQQDGSFEIVGGAWGRGAPAGNYDVLIEWKHTSRPGKRPGSGPDRLKGRYADLKHPLLQAIVQPGGTRLPPFTLTDGDEQ